PEGGVADDLVPVVDGKLAGQQGGFAAIAIIEDLEQIVAAERVETGQSPVVENEQTGAREPVEESGVGAVATGQGESGQELREAKVAGREPLAAGLMAEGTGEVGLSAAGGAGDQDALALADPVAANEPQEDGPVEAACFAEIEVLVG